MDNRTQAKLYYLYMMSDGEVSSEEKILFTSICKQLNISTDEKKFIIKECENIESDKKSTALSVLKKNSKNELFMGDSYLPINSFLNASNKDKGSIFWNLINLGYKDGSFSEEEKKIVEFLRKYLEFDKSIITEMLDTAETMISLTKHMEWVENNITDEDVKNETLKKSKKELKYLQDSINILISELD